VFSDPVLTELELHIEPGDGLLLYTDGVTEARSQDGTFYGADRLAAVLAALAGRPAAEIVEAVVTDVLEFSGGRPRDDIAALLLQAAS